MKLLNFAWVKDRLGKPGEELELPAEVTTVAGLLDWLAGRGPTYESALAERPRIRVAVNQSFAAPEDPVRTSDEIAIFPPVTGG